jgi:cytochrome b
MNDTNSTLCIFVWDLPVRVVHWLMVFSFAGAYLTSESEYWRLVHVTLGYTLAGLVAFRLVWGVAGTRYARFSNFVRGPAAVARYLGALMSPEPEHHTGHNPAGAVAIVLLLLLSTVIVASGWAIYNDLGAAWLEEVHETASNLMLMVVGVHVIGVAVASWRHRENLVGAMVSGKKQGDPAHGISRTWRPLGVLILATVLGFWGFQWQAAPTGLDASATNATRSDGGAPDTKSHDDDD